ncbi:Hypothetical protein ABZS17G119_04113 [Kosakonia cowanii]
MLRHCLLLPMTPLAVPAAWADPLSGYQPVAQPLFAPRQPL